MPEIHPTASLEGDIDLHDDVVVGPYCVLNGPIRIGPGCRLVGNVYLNGPLEMGPRNIVYPFACLGFAPQHHKFDPQTPGLGVVIGEGNTFREHATVHRAFTDEGPTTIGDRNLFMVSAHAGHDCRIASDCIFANGSALGGHVIVDDRVILGGTAIVHQFCRLGRGCMLSGLVGVTGSVPPWFTVTGTNFCGSINIIGMRRNGLSREDIDTVRWVFRMMYRQGLAMSSVREVLRERSANPLVAEYLDFIEHVRQVCSGRPLKTRGSGSARVQTPA